MTPDQLEKYRKQLLDLKNRLDEEIEDLEEEISGGGLAVGETDLHARTSKDAEMAIEKSEEEIQRLVKVALRRLEVGTFGICEDCSGNIIKARLDAIPYTPVCIKCETIREAS